MSINLDLTKMPRPVSNTYSMFKVLSHLIHEGIFQSATLVPIQHYYT